MALIKYLIIISRILHKRLNSKNLKGLNKDLHIILSKNSSKTRDFQFHENLT
jgi:hypothetical protein